MAPCSWEKENLRGQRKDLISHTMIAFRTWRQVLLSITLVIDLSCRRILATPNHIHILKWIWGAVKGMHVQYIVRSNPRARYHMQGTAPRRPHTGYKAERLQRWHAEALRPAKPHPDKSHNPSVNFYLTEGHDLLHWRISSSVTGLSLRVAIFSYHRDGSPQASREPWVGATEILDTSLPDIPNSSPKVQGPASVRVTSFSTRPEPSCSKWL